MLKRQVWNGPAKNSESTTMAKTRVAIARQGGGSLGRTNGSFPASYAPDLSFRFREEFSVKSFGRRLAYESPRGTNPRCAA